MYQRCIFCASDLGKNRELEAFPTGRRLAFDSAKGRLWVVCGRCGRWNLTPLEQRWEAVEEAESCYRKTRVRASTSEIGLGILPGGLELIRVGRPLRPEFAAWRYGGRFRARWVNHVATTGALAFVLVGAATGSAIFAGTGLVAGLLAAGKMRLGTEVDSAVHIPRREGESLTIRTINAGDPRLIRGETRGSWYLKLNHTRGMARLDGEEGIQALGLLLPRLNWVGGTDRRIREAVSDLARTGNPAEYFGVAAARATRGDEFGAVSALPRSTRLALEMAANEDAERFAMDEDLTLLEKAWREAESIAAISDSLLLPDSVRRAFDRLKEADE